MMLEKYVIMTVVFSLNLGARFFDSRQNGDFPNFIPSPPLKQRMYQTKNNFKFSEFHFIDI